jgi:hypothetical protein
MLGEGKRPVLEFEEKEEQGMEELIEKCWESDVEKRKGLRELEREIIVYAPRGITSVNDLVKVEKGSKGEETEERKAEKEKEKEKKKEEKKEKEGEKEKEGGKGKEGKKGKEEEGKKKKKKGKKGIEIKGGKGTAGGERVKNVSAPKEAGQAPQQ